MWLDELVRIPCAGHLRVLLAMQLYELKVSCRHHFFSLIGCGHRACKRALSGDVCAQLYGTGAIGSSCEPYVMLGGLLLVQSV